MLSFECIKNEKSVYFLLTSAFSNNLVTRFMPDQYNWMKRWAAYAALWGWLPKT